MRRRGPDIYLQFFGGKALRARGISSVDQDGNGVYTVRFPPDRQARIETHHFRVTICNADGPRTVQLFGKGGESLQILISDLEGCPADADFQFAGERL